MKQYSKPAKAAGFAVVEALLIIIIIAAVAGVGLYVMHQKNQANKTLNTTTAATTGSTSPTPAAGTTSSIDQLTKQDSQSETNIDNGADGQVQSNLTGANSDSSNVGGAYNESNL